MGSIGNVLHLITFGTHRQNTIHSSCSRSGPRGSSTAALVVVVLDSSTDSELTEE